MLTCAYINTGAGFMVRSVVRLSIKCSIGSMKESIKSLFAAIRHPRLLLCLLRDYFGLARQQRLKPIVDQDSLKEFIQTRSSYVAQVSLYGYLRTRAGMRYPELFDSDTFVVSINIAKWQIWLACVSDLSVYLGGLLMQNENADEKNVAQLIQNVVIEIFTETGIPDDAGDKFTEGVERVRQRFAMLDWQSITDDEGPFTHSPQALLDWAPVIDEFKETDGDIVINSVRFRWNEVRRDCRKALDAAAVLTPL